MATYNSLAIFGSEVQVSIQPIERAVVRRAFFGVNGVFQLDGGFRGRIANVSGKLSAPTPFDLDTLFGILRSYDDGQQYPLMDNKGRTYTACVTKGVAEEGRIEINAATGKYQQRFTISFFLFD